MYNTTDGHCTKSHPCITVYKQTCRAAYNPLPKRWYNRYNLVGQGIWDTPYPYYLARSNLFRLFCQFVCISILDLKVDRGLVSLFV